MWDPGRMILYNGWESAPAAAEADRLEGDVRKASHGRSSYSNGESTMWPNRVSRSAAGRRALPLLRSGSRPS